MVQARAFSGRLLCWAAILRSPVGRSSSSSFWGRQDRVFLPPRPPRTRDVPQERATPFAETFPAPAAILVTDPAG